MDMIMKKLFLEAMGSVATGVSVIATSGEAGSMAMTVSAFASLSADPPLVLACVRMASPICAIIERNGMFTLNVLASGQEHVADCFAGRAGQYPAFSLECVQWSGPDMHMADALVSFNCRLAAMHSAATHRIITGTVTDIVINKDLEPLLHRHGRYRQIAR